MTDLEYSSRGVFEGEVDNTIRDTIREIEGLNDYQRGNLEIYSLNLHRNLERTRSPIFTKTDLVENAECIASAHANALKCGVTAKDIKLVESMVMLAYLRANYCQDHPGGIDIKK